MKELENYLNSLPQGIIQDQDIKNVEKLLIKYWEEIEGSDSTKMMDFKLLRGIENVEWNPPNLSFIIERHGITVLGSSRAERQKWGIDIIQKKADCAIVGYRQIRERQSKLNVELLAKDIFKLICKGKKNDQLKWNNDGSVRIQIGKIIRLSENSATKQTVASRRKRFRKRMDEIMDKEGWQKLKENLYSPTKS
jgi:hypothetical protein